MVPLYLVNIINDNDGILAFEWHPLLIKFKYSSINLALSSELCGMFLCVCIYKKTFGFESQFQEHFVQFSLEFLVLAPNM